MEVVPRKNRAGMFDIHHSAGQLHRRNVADMMIYYSEGFNFRDYLFYDGQDITVVDRIDMLAVDNIRWRGIMINTHVICFVAELLPSGIASCKSVGAFGVVQN